MLYVPLNQTSKCVEDCNSIVQNVREVFPSRAYVNLSN